MRSASERKGLRPEDGIHFPRTSPQTSLWAGDTRQAYLRVFPSVSTRAGRFQLKSISKSDRVSCLPSSLFLLPLRISGLIAQYTLSQFGTRENNSQSVSYHRF